MKTSLSSRLRPHVEAAPWVIDCVKDLEKELNAAYAELNKQYFGSLVMFDREVHARVKQWARDRGLDKPLS